MDRHPPYVCPPQRKSKSKRKPPHAEDGAIQVRPRLVPRLRPRRYAAAIGSDQGSGGHARGHRRSRSIGEDRYYCLHQRRCSAAINMARLPGHPRFPWCSSGSAIARLPGYPGFSAIPSFAWLPTAAAVAELSIIPTTKLPAIATIARLSTAAAST